MCVCLPLASEGEGAPICTIRAAKYRAEGATFIRYFWTNKILGCICRGRKTDGCQEEGRRRRCENNHHLPSSLAPGSGEEDTAFTIKSEAAEATSADILSLTTTACSRGSNRPSNADVNNIGSITTTNAGEQPKTGAANHPKSESWDVRETSSFDLLFACKVSVIHTLPDLAGKQKRSESGRKDANFEKKKGKLFPAEKLVPPPPHTLFRGRARGLLLFRSPVN